MPGFVRSPADLSCFFGINGTGDACRFYRAEVHTILYETKPEIIQRVLPPPLEPYEKPYVLFNFNDFKHVNFDVPYQEPALIIPARHKGVLGHYIIGMTLSTDVGTFSGREGAGYPKKCGDVRREKVGDRFTGSCERHGIKYATMTVDLCGEPNEPEFQAEVAKLFAPPLLNDPEHGNHTINYNFMSISKPYGLLMEEGYPPANLTINWKETIPLEPTVYGKGRIDYLWSDHDPWAELEVVRIIGAQYTVSETALLNVDIADTVPMRQYAPYLFYKWDAHMPCQERDWDWTKG